MKTIKDIINNLGQPSADPTHAYHPGLKKIFDVSTHDRVNEVTKALARGESVMVPKSLRTK